MSESMPDKFDRLLGLLDGLTDTLNTKPSTVQVIAPLGVGGSQVFIVQTYRQHNRDSEGKVTQSADTIFLQTIPPESEKPIRIALPSQVADVIARQRDALTARSRARAGRERAAADKAAGRAPGFLRRKKR